MKLIGKKSLNSVVRFSSFHKNNKHKGQLPQSTEMSTSANIFITGVTGFLGIHLLNQLLRKTNKNIIYCHVRASSHEDALLRIKKSFTDAFLWDSIAETEFHRLRTVKIDSSKFIYCKGTWQPQ